MKVLKTEKQSQDIDVGNWVFSEAYGVRSSPEGNSLIIEPRLSRLLYLLGRHANEIVLRKYLIENIWTDTIVNDESLTRAVADLRKTLSKNFGNSISIDTIPRRGYKLVLQPGPKVYAMKLKISHPIRYTMVSIVFLLLVLFWFLA